MSPFIVFALPRSRTAWLAAFLTYRDWTCHHEIAVDMRSMEDVKWVFSLPNIGSVETAAAPGWWLLRYHVPDLRMAVIRRPVADVVESLMATDPGVATYDRQKLRNAMEYGDRMLSQIAALPGVLSFDFKNLDHEDACAAIFEHCLPYGFDREWWSEIKDRNIQVDIPEFFKRYFANRPAIERFKSVCKAELRNLRRSGVDLRI